MKWASISRKTIPNVLVHSVFSHTAHTGVSSHTGHFNKRIEFGLQRHVNFSKSARACNVSLCFDFYLNVTLRVLHFSRFKPLRKKEHPRNVLFFSYHSNAHFDKLCKYLRTFAWHSIFQRSQTLFFPQRNLKLNITLSSAHLLSTE